jgi:hypothetical protein
VLLVSGGKEFHHDRLYHLRIGMRSSMQTNVPSRSARRAKSHYGKKRPR